MKNREYLTYNDYVEHQKKKTLLPSVQKIKAEKFKKRVLRFQKLFKVFEKRVDAGAKALCLGARRGEEVIALNNMGYQATGVDLVAFPPYVIKGDFHNLPFENKTFRIVYSNAVDHIFDLKKFADESFRVTKRKGYILFHLTLNIWSDEMSLGLQSSSEVIQHFKGVEVIIDKKIKTFAGGLNHILCMKRVLK